MVGSPEEVYRRYIKPLSPGERLKLVEMTAHDLALQSSEAKEKQKRSIMELHGLGKEIWEGVEAQTYVNELRNEWDSRP